MNFYPVLTDLQRLTPALTGHWMPSRGPRRSVGWYGRLVRERERERGVTQFCLWDLMIMRIIYIYIYIYIYKLQYGCTRWTLTKRMDKKLYGNYTRMLRAILIKSSWLHPTKQQLYSHLPSITKTIKIRRSRLVGHCWRSKDELLRDVHLWTSLYGRAKAGWPAPTYIQLLCSYTGCSPGDLPEAMDDKKGWRERVRDIHAEGGT